MKIGLSLYEALWSYVGLDGPHLTDAQFRSLVDLVLENLRHAGTRRIMMRLDPHIMLNFSSGIAFTDANGMSVSTTTGWEVQPIEETDALSDDRFLIVDDGTIPFVLIAQKKPDGGYNTLVSIDQPMIEGARSILRGYPVIIRSSQATTVESYRRAGRMIARIGDTFNANIVSSWIDKALQPLETSALLNALLNASGAVWIGWGTHSAGTRPPKAQLTNTYQVQQLPLSDGSSLQGIGFAGEGQFAQAMSTCAGLLEVRMSQLQGQSNGNRADELMDILSGFSIDDFIANTQLDLGDVAKPSPTTPAPRNGNDSSVDFSTFPMPEDFPLPDDMLSPAATTSPATGKSPVVASVSTAGAQALDVPSDSGVLPTVNKTALSYVGGKISSLRDDILDSGIIRELQQNTRGVLQRFVNQSSDLLMLIDELLYIQRISDQVDADIQSLDLTILVDSLILTYAGEAERRNVTLDYQVPDSVSEINGSPEALNRALMIMLEYAMESAGHGGSIRLVLQEDASQITVSMHDSGTPLTPQKIETLFIPDLSRGGDVSNLGFATLRAIVNAHDAEIEVLHQASENVINLRFSK